MTTENRTEKYARIRAEKLLLGVPENIQNLIAALDFPAEIADESPDRLEKRARLIRLVAGLLTARANLLAEQALLLQIANAAERGHAPEEAAHAVLLQNPHHFHKAL